MPEIHAARHARVWFFALEMEVDVVILVCLIAAAGFLSLAVFVAWFGLRKGGPVRTAWAAFKSAKSK